MGPFQRNDDRGFTLIETLIAVLLLTLVMAALAPMMFGTFRATATTNSRSVATSLAVQASEQIRAFPYYELGYYSSHQPAACATGSLPQVTLDSTAVANEPLYALATATIVNHIPYTIQRCVYWVDSTVSGDTAAYKESVVTVYWTGQGTTLNVTQTSSIYPGGQGGYSSENDFVPGGASTNCGTTPGVPGSVTAVDDTTAPSNTIDVSWTASSPPADYYVVLYTSQNPNGLPIDGGTLTSYSVSPETTATSQQITVGSGTQYWVQVEAVACGNPSGDSGTATATSASSGSTTTTSSTTVPSGSTTTSTSTTTVAPTCSVYGLTVLPTGGSGQISYVAVKNGTMNDYTSNTFTLTLSSSNTAYCSNLYIAYNAGGGTPTACAPGSHGCATDWVQFTAVNTGTFTATAAVTSYDSGGWGQNGVSFVVYNGQGATATPYSPATAANEATCKYNGGAHSSCT